MKLRIASWAAWVSVLFLCYWQSSDMGVGVIIGSVFYLFIDWAHEDHRIVSGLSTMAYPEKTCPGPRPRPRTPPP